MSSTEAPEPASTRAAFSPPKPDPTITTRGRLGTVIGLPSYQLVIGMVAFAIAKWWSYCTIYTDFTGVFYKVPLAEQHIIGDVTGHGIC